jgi:hypothetical protein
VASVHGRSLPPAAWLALFYGVNGVLCLFGAVRPMTAETSVPLLSVLAAVGLGGGAVLWWLGSRTRPQVLHAAVAGMSLLIGLLAWQSVTAVGVLGRYGGDEFVLCLPATDEEGAAEMLRRLAGSHEFAWSGGLATAHAGDTLTTVLARADADLYRNKRSNRS